MTWTKPLDVSLLLPDLRGGGAERITIHLAHEFVRQGHRVEFVLMCARGELLEEARATFPVVELGIERARQVPVALARYLRRRRPDGLLAAIWPLTVVAPIARRISGHSCGVLVSEHSILSLQYSRRGIAHTGVMRASLSLGYRLADAAIGVSVGVARDMAALSGIPTDRFRVIHNPVPSRSDPSFEDVVEAEALWVVPAGRRILAVGRFKAVKNHSLLLRAFARLRATEARLMLLGNGEGEIELRRLAADLGIADRVIFAGFRSDPTPFYRTADLFVLSSNYEGLPTVLIEALACGTPVVSTDCPSGPGEILDGGRYGRLVPVGDEAALAEAMDASLSAEHDADFLRARAREFAPERAAAQYLELLQGSSGATAETTCGSGVLDPR